MKTWKEQDEVEEECKKDHGEGERMLWMRWRKRV